MTKIVELYTDGACRGNPGPGGWGVLLRYDGRERSLMGAVPATTNNRMELQATIEGLRALKRPCHVIVYTDSKYVQDGISKWIHNWRKNNWKTADKKPIKNQDLWLELDLEAKKHEIEWRWVKGHSDHPENDRVDALARLAIDELLLL